jgi:hypothetical protein
LKKETGSLRELHEQLRDDCQRLRKLDEEPAISSGDEEEK